jgi:hypothetical protein
VVVAVIAAIVVVAVAVGYPASLVIALGGFVAVMYLAQTSSGEPGTSRRSSARRVQRDRDRYRSLPRRQRFVVRWVAGGVGAIAGLIIDGQWNGVWSTVAAFAVAIAVADLVFSLCLRAASRSYNQSPQTPSSN